MVAIQSVSTVCDRFGTVQVAGWKMVQKFYFSLGWGLQWERGEAGWAKISVSIECSTLNARSDLTLTLEHSGLVAVLMNLSVSGRRLEAILSGKSS